MHFFLFLEKAAVLAERREKGVFFGRFKSKQIFVVQFLMKGINNMLYVIIF